MVFDYVDGAAQSECTALANRQGLDQVALLPAPLRDVSQRTSEVTLFGRSSRLPIIIGPTGFNGALWPRGDIELARAAEAMGIPFVMSYGANVSMAELRSASGARQWFQLYVPRESQRCMELVKSVAEAGFEALQITVDTAIPGRRLRDVRNGFGLPLRWTPGKLAQVLARPGWALRMARHGMPTPVIIRDAFTGEAHHATPSALMAKQVNPAVTWETLKRVRDLWAGPLIVKGLCNPREVSAAIATGIDGIVISNHGGRQLDGEVSTIAMLPEFVAAAQGRLTLLIDSGFRSGTDVLKALALGATAVQIGRATLYGLAAAGQAGAERALSILATELDLGMGLCNVTNLAEAGVLETRRR